MKKRSKSKGFIIRLAVSIVLLGLILCKIDWSTTVSLVRRSDPLWWMVAAFITIAAVVISAYKWQMVLTAQGVRVPLPKLTSSYFIGLFFNNFLPTSMGGDAFRAYDAVKFSGETPKAIASVVAERVLASATLGVTALAGLLIGYRSAGRFTWLVVAFNVGCLVLVWASLDIRWLEMAAARMSWLNSDKIRSRLAEAKEALKAPVQDKTALFSILAASMVFQVTVVLVNLAVFKALNIDVSARYLFIFVPIISAISMLPVSINGLGIQQGASIVCFGAIGLSATEAAAQSLGFLLVVTVVSLAGAVLLVMRKSDGKVVYD